MIAQLCNERVSKELPIALGPQLVLGHVRELQIHA